MNILIKINKIITYIEAVIMAGSLLIVSATLIANVFCRWFLHHAISGAEEIGTFGIVFMTFVGLSYCVTTGKHINMLAVFDVMPEKMRKADAVLISLVTGITCGVLTWISFTYVQEMAQIGKVSVNLQIPIMYIDLLIAMSFLFATFQYALIFFMNIIHKDEIYLCLAEKYQVPVKEGE